MIIYITKNLINNKKYIGKDSYNDPNYLGSGALLLEDIKKYGRENFKKEILEHCIKENLGEREEYWIYYFNAVKSKDFYNIRSKTSGWFNKDLNPEKYDYVTKKIGDGNRGKIITQETKDKISNNKERSEKLRQANAGKPKPEGFSEIIRQKAIGRIYTDEHKQKISKGKLGKPHPKSGKRILQLDKEGNTIQEYNSIDDAAKYIGRKRSNISCCLIGKSKTAYGYQWKYLQ
jgi:group I intron endonuclease